MEEALKFGPGEIRVGRGADAADFEVVLPSGLPDAQVGYARGADGKRLPGGWRDNWLVVGYDSLLGDPLFVDLGEPTLPAYTAAHGAEGWAPELVAASFEGLLPRLKRARVELTSADEDPDPDDKALVAHGTAVPPSPDVLARLRARVTADWGHLGTRESPGGTIQVAHMPDIAPQAWHHKFFPGTTTDRLLAELDHLPRPRPRPKAWQDVLLNVNGLNIFQFGIKIFGVHPGQGPAITRVDHPMKSEDQYLQRGKVVSEADYVIGASFVNADVRSRLVLRADNTCLAVSENGKKVIASWASVEEMLNAEYERHAAQHDERGRRVWG